MAPRYFQRGKWPPVLVVPRNVSGTETRRACRSSLIRVIHIIIVSPTNMIPAKLGALITRHSLWGSGLIALGSARTASTMHRRQLLSQLPPRPPPRPQQRPP